jgi:HEAT repeat protein
MNWAAKVVVFLLMSSGSPNPAFPDEPRPGGAAVVSTPGRTTPRHDGQALALAGAAAQDDREPPDQGVAPDKPSPEAGQAAEGLIRGIRAGNRFDVDWQKLDDPEVARAAIPGLVDALKSRDVSARRLAALAFQKLGPLAEETVPPLTGLLSDRRPEVFIAAAEALASFGSEASEAVPALIKALGDDHAGVRGAAAAVLALIGPGAREAIPHLVRALGDPEVDVRRRVLGALAEVNLSGDQSAIIEVARRLADRDSTVRVVAANALKTCGPRARSAVPALIEALRDPSSSVRKSSARALVMISPYDPRIVAPFWRLIGDAIPPDGADKEEDELLMITTKESMSSIANIRIIDDASASAALSHENENARLWAAVVLIPQGRRLAAASRLLAGTSNFREGCPVTQKGAIEALKAAGPGAVPALIDSMDDGLGKARWHAAEILGACGPDARPAIPALIRSLRDRVLHQGDKEYDVEAKAISTLIRVGEAAVPAVVLSMSDENAGVRAASARILGGMGPAAKEAVPRLIDALQDPDIGVRNQTIKALGRIGPPATAATAGLAMLEKSDDDEVRKLATEALGRIRTNPPALGAVHGVPDLVVGLAAGDEAQRLELLRALASPDARMRRHAAGGLGHLTLPSTAETPALVRAARDADPLVRLEAIRALGLHGAELPAIWPTLNAALVGQDDDPREAAILALCRMLPRDSLPLLTRNLAGRDVVLRRASAQALCYLGPAARPAMPAMLKALYDEDPRVREWAGRGVESIDLGGFGSVMARLEAVEDWNSEPYRALLRDLLHDREEKVRLLTLQILGRQLDFESAREHHPIESDKAQEVFLALGRLDFPAIPGSFVGFARHAQSALSLIEAPIGDRCPAVREQAIRLLGGLGPVGQSAVPRLLEALRDPSAAIRQGAVTALGRIVTNGVGTERAVPALVEALKDADSGVRRASAVALTAIDPTWDEAELAFEKAVPTLVAALASPYQDVRSYAVRHLAELLDFDHNYTRRTTARIAVPALAVALADRDPAIREKAAAALGQIGTGAEIAVPALSKALEDESAPVRRWSAKAVERIGRRAATAVLPLRAALRDRDAKVRWRAAEALGRIGTGAREAVPDLVAALEDREDQARWRAAEALGRIGRDAKAALPTLHAALPTEDAAGRVNIAKALWRIERRPREVVPILIDVMENDANSHRYLMDDDSLGDFVSADREAFLILAEIGPAAKAAIPALLWDLDGTERVTALIAMGPEARTAVPALIPALQARHFDDLRRNAASVLASIGPEARDAVPALIKCLAAEEYDGVRHMSTVALASIGPFGPGAVSGLIGVLKDSYDADTLRAATDALARIGLEARQSAPAIRELLQTPSPRTRVFAALALWRIDHQDQAALRLLTDALKDSDAQDRGTAAMAFPSLGPDGSNVVPELIKALKDRDPGVREWVADAIGKIGPAAKEAVPALIQSLGDESGDTRRWAAIALGMIGRESKFARLALNGLLKDEVGSVRVQSALALWRIDRAANAVPAIIDVLKDEDPGGRVGAAEASVPRKKRIEAADAALWSRSQDRMEAAAALVAIGRDAESAIPALEELSRDDGQRVDVRRQAAAAVRSLDRGAVADVGR